MLHGGIPARPFLDTSRRLPYTFGMNRSTFCVTGKTYSADVGFGALPGYYYGGDVSLARSERSRRW